MKEKSGCLFGSFEEAESGPVGLFQQVFFGFVAQIFMFYSSSENAELQCSMGTDCFEANTKMYRFVFYYFFTGSKRQKDKFIQHISGSIN